MFYDLTIVICIEIQNEKMKFKRIFFKQSGKHFKSHKNYLPKSRMSLNTSLQNLMPFYKAKILQKKLVFNY